MILDKILQLQKAYGGITDKDAELLGFKPAIENADALRKKILEGKWSSLALYNTRDLDITSMYRIMPDLPGNLWPEYNITYEGSFYASDILSALLYRHIELLIKFPESCKQYEAMWPQISGVLLPVYKLLGGTDDLEDIKEIVFDKTMWANANDTEATRIAKYRSFCLHRDPSYGNQFLWKLLDAIKNADNVLPEYPDHELGIYNCRITSIMAMRAYALSVHAPYEKLEEFYMRAFMIPHGYDIEGVNPGYYPGGGPGSASDIYRLAGKLCNQNKFSSTTASVPEFKAAEALLKAGVNKFVGMEYIEAAAILDEGQNEPLRAWNCLVSAGYWAGLNMPEGQEVIINAAISLCKKHNWIEAADALKYNLDVLQTT